MSECGITNGKSIKSFQVCVCAWVHYNQNVCNLHSIPLSLSLLCIERFSVTFWNFSQIKCRRMQHFNCKNGFSAFAFMCATVARAVCNCYFVDFARFFVVLNACNFITQFNWYAKNAFTAVTARCCCLPACLQSVCILYFTIVCYYDDAQVHVCNVCSAITILNHEYWMCTLYSSVRLGTVNESVNWFQCIDSIVARYLCNQCNTIANCIAPVKLIWWHLWNQTFILN